MSPILPWHWLPYPGRPRRVIGRVTTADEVPVRLPRHGAIVVGPQDAPTWVAFDCPCPERHRVMLNLDSRRRPVWTLGRKSRLTISPSVDEFRGSTRCHYFIRDGRTKWV
jgi:hypothetical protein